MPDVAALQAARVPLWTQPGRGGGIHLLDGWRTRLDGLTGDEAAALFVAGTPDAAGQLGLSALAAAAQEKVLAPPPPDLRSRATLVRQRFHLDAAGWPPCATLIEPVSGVVPVVDREGGTLIEVATESLEVAPTSCAPSAAGSRCSNRRRFVHCWRRSVGGWRPPTPGPGGR